MDRITIAGDGKYYKYYKYKYTYKNGKPIRNKIVWHDELYKYINKAGERDAGLENVMGGQNELGKLFRAAQTMRPPGLIGKTVLWLWGRQMRCH